MKPIPYIPGDQRPRVEARIVKARGGFKIEVDVTIPGATVAQRRESLVTYRTKELAQVELAEIAATLVSTAPAPAPLFETKVSDDAGEPEAGTLRIVSRGFTKP